MSFSSSEEGLYHYNNSNLGDSSGFASTNASQSEHGIDNNCEDGRNIGLTPQPPQFNYGQPPQPLQFSYGQPSQPLHLGPVPHPSGITFTPGVIPMGVQMYPGPPIRLGNITIPLWGHFRLLPILPQAFVAEPGPVEPMPSSAGLQILEQLQAGGAVNRQDFGQQQIPIPYEGLEGPAPFEFSRPSGNISSLNSGCVKKTEGTGRRSDQKAQMEAGKFCQLCKSNRELPEKYLNHVLKDELGRTQCPILRNFKCPLCGESGDNGHTIKYCPTKISKRNGGGGNCNVVSGHGGNGSRFSAGQRPEETSKAIHILKREEVTGAEGEGDEGVKVPYRMVRTSTGKHHSLKY